MTRSKKNTTGKPTTATQSVSVFIMEYRSDNEFMFSHKLTSRC